MSAIINIAAYQFATLQDLKPLREQLRTECRAWGLKGTILLSPEGINLFVAGKAAEIGHLLERLRWIPGLETLTPKYSESAQQPFKRMLVRLKKEIIAFGVEGINPALRTSPKLPAQTLKQWLDEGKPVTLLDTRNDYEVKLGTFKGAQALGIDHFRDFPEAVRKLPEALKQQPVVMFCTGGIRCEKAGPFMEQEGFEQIYQLDGGILKYFEECRGEHYEGECFVFDQRVGVDPALRETASAICHACQTPLMPAEQEDPRFVPGISCPYCHRTDEQQREERLAASRQRLREAAAPLPGSRPYDNRRPLNVPASCDGLTLLDMLDGLFPHVGRETWLGVCERGELLDENGQAVPAGHRVREGGRYQRLQRHLIEPEVNAAIDLLYEDEALLVLNKPAPLPMHPAGRFNRNTLQHLLNTAYAPRRVRPAHRLDANTTGLVVCALSRHFANLLQAQFARAEVEKVYVARVQGQPREDGFTCEVPISDEAGELGTREVAEENGQPARTDFRVIRRDGDGTSLLEARPATGRTNQIRVHLWHLGWPVLGDQAYLPGRRKGMTQTLETAAPPLCLHAWRLGFRHPVTGAWMTFEATPQAWASSEQPVEEGILRQTGG